MKPLDIFLLMLKAAEGEVKGKTLVHKQGYFLNILAKLDLFYQPHYYGPYSPELEAAIGQAKALGFVEQRVVNYGGSGRKGFEVKRFDFALTEDGEAVVNDLLQRKLEECRNILECLQKISSAGEDDYVRLSIAAKAHHVLKTAGQPLTPRDIVAEAKKYDWEISEQAILDAVQFLKDLGLVATDDN